MPTMYGKKFPSCNHGAVGWEVFSARRTDAHVQNQTDDDRRLPMRRGAVCTVRNARVDHLPLPHVPESSRRPVRGASQGLDCPICLDPRRARPLPKFISGRTPFLLGLRHATDVPLPGRRRDRGHHWQPRRRRHVPPTKNFGIEARLPWIDLLAPGRLPDSPTAEETGATESSSAGSTPITKRRPADVAHHLCIGDFRAGAPP